MSEILLVAVWIAIVVLVRRARDRAALPEPLCRTCVFAHIERGTRREAVFCSFGGALRRIRGAVCECTDFRDKRVPARPAVVLGFVKIRDTEAARAERVAAD